MEEFVQMSLKAYDELKSNNECLRRALKEERESHNKHIVQAERTIKYSSKKIEQYKKYILELNCKILDVEKYSLEECLDINSWTYGMYYRHDLLNLGFTKQELDEFITDKYEEYVKEKEEDEEEEDKKEEDTDD